MASSSTLKARSSRNLPAPSSALPQHCRLPRSELTLFCLPAICSLPGPFPSCLLSFGELLFYCLLQPCDAANHSINAPVAQSPPHPPPLPPKSPRGEGSVQSRCQGWLRRGHTAQCEAAKAEGTVCLGTPPPPSPCPPHLRECHREGKDVAKGHRRC